MRKFLKWSAIVLLSPVVLLLILTALLYVPFIQNWVAQRVAQYASEQTGMQISVEHVDLDFPLDLGIDGVRIVRPSMPSDTIADIGRAVADVRLWPLLKGTVVLDALELNDAKINSADFIGDLRLQGTIGSLSLSSPGIDLANMTVELREPTLKDTHLNIFMSDTAAVDTSSTEGWRIRFDRFQLERTRLNLAMDSAALFTDSATRISLFMGQGSLSQADLDLGLGRFRFGPIDWRDGALAYGSDVSISQLSLGLDSLYYYGDILRLGIAHASLHEDSTDLQLSSLQGRLSMDGDAISLRDFQAATPHSSLSADAHFDPLATSDIQFNGSIGRNDLSLFMPDLTYLPPFPLMLHGKVRGSMEQMAIEQLTATMPTVLHVEASGDVGNLNGSPLLGRGRGRLPDQLLADLQLKGNLYDATPFSRLLDLPPGYTIPRGLGVEGTLNANGQRYLANMTARDGSGIVRLDGTFTPQNESYAATLDVHELNLRHFMPRDSIGLLSGSVELSGRGLNILSPGSQMDANIDVQRLDYGHMHLDSVAATALLRGSNVEVHADLGLSNLDMLALGFGSEPATLALGGSIDLTSDFRQQHHLSALFSNISIRDSAKTHYPEDIGLLLKAGRDTTTVRMQSGDLILKLDSGTGYEELLSRLSALADTVARQIDQRTIDQQLLKGMLPTAKLYIVSQRDNPLADILRASTGIDFRNLDIDLTTSPVTGINGSARLEHLSSGGLQIDTINLNLADRGKGLTFNGQVTNSRKSSIPKFNVRFDGLLQEHGASFGVRYYDDRGQLNTRIGAKAEMAVGGLRFQLIPNRPTIGYREFALNADNFLLLDNNQKLEANIDLKADDGTHLKVYTENQDSTMLQDITISVHQLNLGDLTANLPFLPAISGTVEGDYHLLMDADRNISIASDMNVAQMAYEGSPIGNLGSEFVYLLREDGTHVVDATLLLADEPIALLQGSMLSNGLLDATVELTSLPLSIANGFMPDQLLGFEGFANGTLSLKGDPSALMANGQVTFNDGYLLSNPYGMRMRFGQTPLEIKNSHLLFNDFTLYATAPSDARQHEANGNPLNINGSVDLLGLTPGQAIDLRLTARNFQLVNAKQKKESVAYGRMFVNFFARLGGSLQQLNMRGRLDVLGTTDLNYILLDSPLSTDNQMDELVHFTDFSDTTTVSVQRPESDALDLDVNLNIDQGAHVRCALNADQTNYVDLLGGGQLRMRMDADGLNLSGRYTVESGTMKYSLPVIPLKTFTIKEGSYVEFTGQPANPTLNLTATERTRASVGTEDGQNRNVSFDCGVVITQTLENMGLQFTISAPEDMQIQNELASMSVEQRGKLAVTMLTTGMYLADGNTNSFSMNSALSSFLQSEINSITAGALKTVDLQLGLDNTVDAAGQMHTDYSFRFAKRFWNNRLNVQIGGKVSTGAEMQGQNQSFFDNVTMEYRLSPTSNQYVKLFYNQNVYDWLEGYTGEYGGGYIWKRKLDRLTDIFKSEKVVTRRDLRPLRSDSLRPQRNDTLRIRTNDK